MPQQSERLGQLANRLRRQGSGLAECDQRGAGFAVQHLGHPRGLAQQQVLRDEFEVDQPAAPVAQIPGRRPRPALGDPAPHVRDIDDQALRVARLPQRRLDRRRSPLA